MQVMHCVTYIIKKQHSILEKNTTRYKVKHGGGSVMVWGSFAASGSAWVAVTDRTENVALLSENAERECLNIIFETLRGITS